jgi:hypothetical protein
VKDIQPLEPGGAIADERRRLRRVRLVVDLVGAVLAQQQPLSRSEADRLIAQARTAATSLIPGTGSTFDLIIRPRYERILRERGIVV